MTQINMPSDARDIIWIVGGQDMRRDNIIDTITSIKADVAQEYGVTVAEIDGPSRATGFVIPRHEAILRAFEQARGRVSYPRLGQLFGGRDHSTIIHAIKRAKERRERAARLVKEMSI